MKGLPQYQKAVETLQQAGKSLDGLPKLSDKAAQRLAKAAEEAGLLVGDFSKDVLLEASVTLAVEGEITPEQLRNMAVGAGVGAGVGRGVANGADALAARRARRGASGPDVPDVDAPTSRTIATENMPGRSADKTVGNSVESSGNVSASQTIQSGTTTSTAPIAASSNRQVEPSASTSPVRSSQTTDIEPTPTRSLESNTPTRTSADSVGTATPQTRGVLGPNAGRRSARDVSPGGNERSITGHGGSYDNTPKMTVPEGSHLVWPRHNHSILDETGRVIERMDVEEFAKARPDKRERIINQQLDEMGIKDPFTRHEVLADFEGVRVAQPGDQIDDYLIGPPEDLSIYEGSTSVEQDTRLSDILEKDKGYCALGTCTERIDGLEPKRPDNPRSRESRSERDLTAVNERRSHINRDKAQQQSQPEQQTEVEEPRKLYRQDNFPHSHEGAKPGRLKSHVNESGDLSPASSTGKASIIDHIRGSEPRKSDSPYTSFSMSSGVAKSYGEKTIVLDVDRLQQDINSGIIKEVEIVDHSLLLAEHDRAIQRAQDRFDANSSKKNEARLERAKMDKDNWLFRSCRGEH